MIFAKKHLQRDQLEEAVNAIIPLLGPEVERIRYTVGEDWSGDPAIYFKIVLSDESSSDDRIGKTIKQIQSTIDRHLEPFIQSGFFCYFDYRSHFELEARQEKAWT